MSILLWEKGAPLAEGSNPAEGPSITPYLVDRGQPNSCIIVCPGGGYNHLAEPKEGETIANWLNEIGLSAVVLHYRVAPYRHPCPFMDAQRTIRLLRARAEEWNLDPNRIGILGFSAGGHLAATAGTRYDFGDPQAEDPIERESSRPDLMVLCYAGISMIEFPHNKHLLGEDAAEGLRLELSNEKHVTPETPPAFLWMTANDEKVPVKHNLLFAAALDEQKVPFEMHLFESGKHGLGLAKEHPSIKPWTELCEAWLKKRGF
ncbi:alpha/beta hydrolase [Paenibacillus humicola]|uniref:alpha/beta hydrolase n=1 Tax=Paenibacillus humicola TaxID=3110540 RepID=UPI00237A6EF4|nr:alpha/beta hydrolase [Paenibacillus humicola]